MDNLTLTNKYLSPTGNSFYEKFLASRNASKNSTPNNYYMMKTPQIFKPKGKLAHAPIIPNPVKGLLKGSKDFKKAMNGKGTDYSVGMLNDPALALGTASIATVLSSAEKSAVGKVMKFVGAGSWLASMHLWPKVFLAQPVKAMTGVDMNLEYINSQKERKPFWMDPQYTPDDLLTRKILDNAAKKLNVPEDIKNRDEETKRRMRKVATGVNTWWMLSAGFATPIMASLFGYNAEKPVEQLINRGKMTLAEAHLEAAEFDTGSDNPLVKPLSKLVQLFSGADRAMQKEEQTLAKLLKEDNLSAIESFFKRLTPSKTLRENVLPEVRNIYNNAGDDYEDAMKGLFKGVKKLSPQVHAVEKYLDATDSLWGEMRTRFLNGLIGDVLKIKGNDLKIFAENPRSVVTNTPISQQYIQSIAKNGRTDKAAREIERLIEAPNRMTERAEELVTKLCNQIVEKFKSTPLADAADRQTNVMNLKARYRGIGIKASLNGWPGLIRQNGEDARVLQGVDGNDLWNHLQRLETKERKDFLDYVFGKKNPIVKQVMDFVENKASREGLAVHMHTALGENPPDMLCRGAQQYHPRGRWFNRIGIIGFGTLLATTGIALWQICSNAKKNEQPKKEDA